MEKPVKLIVDELKKNEIKFVVTLPDEWTKELLAIIAEDSDLIHIPVAREDEGVGICVGLSLAGKGSALIIQNAGLLLCANALKSLALKYRISVLMLISNRGTLEEDKVYHAVVGRGLATGPFLKALEIPYLEVSSPEEVGKISQAYQFSRLSDRPVAALLGKRVLVTPQKIGSNNILSFKSKRSAGVEHGE